MSIIVFGDSNHLRTQVDAEWGDTVCVWMPGAADSVHVGVADADSGANATATLTIEEAAQLGYELSLAVADARRRRPRR